MRYVPYVWVRWNQNFYNLDIHRNYMYFHDPIWSKRSVKYDPDQYYGFKKLWFSRFLMVFKDFQGFSSLFSWTEGGINKKQMQKSRKSRKITRVRSLSRFFSILVKILNLFGSDRPGNWPPFKSWGALLNHR